MTFDADAYLASEAPPTFTVGGHTYVGRLLSAEEQLRHLVALARLEDGTATDAEARRIVDAFVHELFPDPIAVPARAPWWRRLRRPPEPQYVVDLFRAIPMGAQLAAVQSFAEVLARSMAPTAGPTTTPGAPFAKSSIDSASPDVSSTSASSSRASSPDTAPAPTTTPGAIAPGMG